jgi:hypothetical protein
VFFSREKIIKRCEREDLKGVYTDFFYKKNGHLDPDQVTLIKTGYGSLRIRICNPRKKGLPSIKISWYSKFLELLVNYGMVKHHSSKY